MIDKNEIITLAKNLSLSPDTIEKDYVLNWLLWRINKDVDFADNWLFKGGTSLKKCFFETFRFSEDLDFTLKISSHFTTGFLMNKFYQIADTIYDEIGIKFFKDKFKFKFKIISKDNGKFSAQGRIQYNGPLRRKSGIRSIKLDLTNDEIIILGSKKMDVYHPYSDMPQNGISANCYAFEEVIAEKIRALGQRARPRDLYDVIHFFRNKEMIENPLLIYDTLVRKCDYKQINVPTYKSIEQHEKLEELHGQYVHMLAHQLPTLPPIESFWKDLKPFFNWIENNFQEKRTISSLAVDGVIFQPGRITNAFAADTLINNIQYAAANRVCVKFIYHDKIRTVEPLRIEKSKANNLILLGHERGSSQPKRFSLSEISKVEITSLPYEEREYPIEINVSGTVTIYPVKRKRYS